MPCSDATATRGASGSTATCAIGRWASSARGAILIPPLSSTSALGGSERGGASPPELQIARAIAAPRAPTAAVIAPEVHRLAPQGVGAAEAALEPGAAGQAHLEPALGTAPHWAAYALAAVTAVGRDIAYDARG